MAQELTDAEVFGSLGPAPAEPATASQAGELSDADVFGAPDDSAARLRLSVDDALKNDPERSAQVYRLRDQTGLPAEVIDRNFDDVDRRVKLESYGKLKEQSPFLAGLMGEPEFARVAHDDLPPLTDLEGALRVVKNSGRALGASVYRGGAGLYGALQAAFELEGSLLPFLGGREVAAGMSDQRRNATAWADYVRGPQEGAGFAERAFYSGIESAGLTAQALPASIATGSPAPLLYGLSAVTGGEAFGQARDKGVALPQALTFGASQAVIEYATEKIPGSKLLGDLAARTGFMKTLTGQLVTEIPGEQVATILQDLNEWAVLNPEKPFSEYLAERPEAAAQTLIATIVGTAAQTSIASGVQSVTDRMSGRVERAQADAQTAEVLSQITALATNSKLAERSPESFKRFVDEAAQDGPVQDVYVDAETLAQTLQQSGVELEQVFKIAPSVAEQLDEAVASKSDVRIPLGEYAAAIATTDAGAKLVPHLRASPEALSQAEAKEFMQGQAEQFKREAEQILAAKDFSDAWSESAKAVEDELLTQLTQANRFTVDVNRSYATLMRDFYSVQADRLGITPEEMYVRYPLRIQAEPVAGEGLDQSQEVPRAVATLAADYKAAQARGDRQLAARIKPKIDAEIARLKLDPAAVYGEEGGPVLFQSAVPQDTEVEALRARVAELEQELRTSPVTGMRNMRAFEEDEALGWPLVAAADMDGLKRLNSAVGHEQADKVLRTMGGVILKAESEAGEGVRAYHRSGDELAFRFQDQATADTFMRELEARLESVSVEIEIESSAGKEQYVYDGIGISYGLGETYEKADKQTEIAKADRLRQGRREEPRTDEARPPRRLRRVAGGEGLFGASGEPQLSFFQSAQSARSVDTPEFKKWFGDSKVVDENGEPLVVYHGGAPGITEFDAGKIGDSFGVDAEGFFFTSLNNDMAGAAGGYARRAGGAVYSVYLSLQNPYTLEKFASDLGVSTDDLISYGGEVQSPIYVFDENRAEVISRAKAGGHDGVAFTYAQADGFTESMYIAFRPEQIKSAIGNRGTFDPNDPNILNQGGPLPDAAVVDAAEDLVRFAEQFKQTPDEVVAEWQQRPPRQGTAYAEFWARFQNVSTAAKFLANNPERLAAARKQLDDSAAAKKRHAQRRGEMSVGSIARGEPTTISLLQSADLSTFLHEAGHFYLEVLADIAAQPNAPPAIIDDMQKALDWFGVKDLTAWRAMDIEQKRPFHEQWARGFEAYLFEGKAPSTTLGKLFARFRSWMLNVYRSISSLNVTLSDEVRGVFDRLIATQKQIEEAEAARAYTPLFATKPGGMTAAEWKAYQEADPGATEDAITELGSRGLRDMKWLQNARSRKLKELQAQAAQQRAEVHREVVAEVQALPVYAAQRFILKGDLPGFEGSKGVKLSLPALRVMYGDAADAPWRRLVAEKPRLVVEEGGIHPDEISGIFGYTSGDHMVREILDAEPESSAIAGRADQRLLERYGELTTPEAIEAAANAAIHNEARAKFIATELKALRKATGGRKILTKAAKAFAAQIVERKRLRDIRPAQYEAAEARAARNAEKALGKGNTIEAATEKRNQLVNNYATRAAYDALDFFESGLRYLKKFDREATRKNLDPDYVDQIDALLERFDLRKGQSLKDIEKRKALAEWITDQEAQGLTPVIDDRLRNEAFRKHVKDTTLEEFRGLVDAIKNIEHLGRLKKKLLTAADQREFDKAVAELAGSIESNAKRTVPEQSTTDRGLLVKAGRLFRGFFAEHRKYASLMQELDGYAEGGAAWGLLVRNMNKAGDFEAVENEKATAELGKLFAPILKQNLGEKVFFPAVGKSYTLEARLGMALNMGNEINRERVLTGEKLSPEQLQTILDSLSKEHWDFVQGVWDYLESFRPQIAAKERRVTGIEPEWVEASPVQTRFGEYKGGYYPIRYDPFRSSRSASDIAAEVERQTMQGLYTRAQTRRGHLKARTESTGRPIRYDLGVVFEHTSQVIHDLAWHEYLIDANRLLNDKTVDAAIRDHYGPEKLAAMKDTLTDIAKGFIGPQSSWGVVANRLRYGATIAGLGWRLSTSLLQPIGLTQSMSRIGSKWVLKGMKHWLGDTARLENSVRLVGEKSAFMRLRAKTLQREINEIRNKVDKKDSKLQASYFYLIQKMQLVADMPTWWGAYEKAMSENDMTEEKAVALADQAVIDAQGSGQIKDLSGIERGKEGQKLFTVFYSFFNTTYNNTARAIGRTNFKSPASVAFLVADMALLYMIPAALGVLLKHALKGDWDDGDELAEELVLENVSYLLGTVVGLREVTAGARALAGKYSSYSGPASVRLFAELQKLGQQTAQGEADAAFWKALNSVGGIIFHYPAGQLNQTVEGAAALLNGETENPLALISGPGG